MQTIKSLLVELDATLRQNNMPEYILNFEPHRIIGT